MGEKLGNLSELPKDIYLLIYNSYLSKYDRVALDYVLHNKLTILHDYMEYLALHGYLELLKWTIQLGFVFVSPTLASRAGQGGHLNILQWIDGQNEDLGNHVGYYAAMFGHLHILKWLKDNDLNWSYQICKSAAMGGHIEILRWAKENGCELDETCKWTAAENGHLNVLKWLRENGCPWDKWVCIRAADGGHLDVLEWAYENGAELDTATILLNSNLKPEIVSWVKKHI